MTYHQYSIHISIHIVNHVIVPKRKGGVIPSCSSIHQPQITIKAIALCTTKRKQKMVCTKCQKKLKTTELATPGVKRKSEMYYGSPTTSTSGGSSADRTKATLGNTGIGKVLLHSLPFFILFFFYLILFWDAMHGGKGRIMEEVERIYADEMIDN